MFNEGDTVLVYWGQDNGWWYGAIGGKQGWFPESYVEVSTVSNQDQPPHQGNLYEQYGHQPPQ